MSGVPVHPDGKFKRIVEYTPEELQDAVLDAVEECKEAKLDFYTILRGIDAYMERRNRKYRK